MDKYYIDEQDSQTVSHSTISLLAVSSVQFHLYAIPMVWL